MLKRAENLVSAVRGSRKGQQLKFDVTVFAEDLNAAAGLAQTVEAYGFDGLWVAEAAHNPFLPLAHATMATDHISLGTAIAVAFPRSPLQMAQTAWDLAEQSGGRFILGLGTQIKPHITKRFSAMWGKPIPQLREYIGALRAIWRSYQAGSELNYQGQYYKVSLSESAERPQPMPYASIPIYIAGVNTGLARLAGEICDGFHVHSFHTPRYLREVLLPAFEAGRARGAINPPAAVAVLRGICGHGRKRSGSRRKQAADQVADRLLRQYAQLSTGAGIAWLAGCRAAAERLAAAQPLA